MTRDVQNDLVRGLYAGIRAERPFKEFLIRLADSLSSDAASIVIEGKSRDWPGAVFSGHASDSRRSAYNGVFHQDPFANLPLNHAITMQEHLGDHRFQTLPFMTRFMQDLGVQNVLGIDVREPAGTRIRLRATRVLGERDFGAAEKAVFEALAPHLSEAAALFLQLDAAHSRQELYAGALDRLAIGAVVVDRNAQILCITGRAETILRERRLLAQSEGRARIVPSSGHPELTEAIRSLASGEGATDGPWPVSLQSDCGEALTLIVRRAGLSTRLDRPLEGTAMITIAEAWAPVAPSAETLSRLFGLTPAEAELAALLGQGLDLDSASALLQISKNTSKAHLRMVFSKTRVTRQSSLVRLLLRSVDELSLPPPPAQDRTGQPRARSDRNRAL